eukprot:CAMPEP_0119026512 /NCGR_PEP_ID=MMETSP1176-20130426/35591_1 /TAXON_ID=265551 /ORGANISM="Synedropsis recta cf, Strain CCMP1620" /LENGTH=257 /DNA_ID=CAMNT_0006982243 /DNA_START=38 /DNA_END=808 /DNA_ORIENTATION=-
MSSDSWETKILKATDGSYLVPIVLVVVASVSFLLFRRMNKPMAQADDKWAKEVNDTKSSTTASSGSLKNIWDERQKNGSAALDEQTQKTDDDGKPFGSSYYYAHNSLRTTGGYKDGLRMEDYQMGTPRLLSKGGVDLRDQAGEEAPAANNKSSAAAASPAIAPEKRTRAAACIPITKYLWDDPGDHKAIGTIRIDQLAENLSWKEADVTDIQIDLKNETVLTVLVSANDKTYRLHIPQCYGKVEEVKKVSKNQRLLV